MVVPSEFTQLPGSRPCSAPTFFLLPWFGNAATGFLVVGYRTVKPAFGNERIEIILPKGLAVFDANKRLDFTRLAGLLAEPENLDGDMAGDLAGRLDFMFLGFYDKRGMKGQAHEKTGSVSV
jgi:hypothetical protein